MSCAPDLWLGFWMGIVIALAVFACLAIGFTLIKEKS